MTKKYLIADLHILIDCYDDANLISTHKPYEYDFECPADIQIHIKKSETEIEKSFKDVTKLCPGKYFSRSNGIDTVIDYDESKGKIIAITEFKENCSVVDITALNIKRLYDISDKCFVANLIDSAMHYSIRSFDGIVFHSSALSFSGEGVVFSAESGTGKSTHTSLWLKQYPGSKVINDDTPIIRVHQDDSVMLYGTPWAGSTGINQNEKVPLRAIVFLSRGAENKINHISPGKVMQGFFDAMTSSLTPKMMLDTVDILNRICLKVPAFSLECNMDSSAAICAKEFIFDKRFDIN